MALQPVDKLYSNVSDLHEAYGLTDPAQRQAVEEAYGAFREHSGPFMASIAAHMLDDLRSDVQNDPNRVVAFLGRDGHSLAAAVRGLDPEFFDQHCREVVVSRAVVDAALQDLEKNAGERFPEAEAFRGARNKVDPADVDGAYRHLTDYLRGSGIPVGHQGSTVTVVDTSFKGTVQELMSAAYPQTEIQGRYAFLATSPHDPHPGTKQGYVFHQEPDAVWQGLPQTYLPEQREQTFGNQDALGVIEETLHGPLGSPRSIGAQGPDQLPQRLDQQPLVGLNPVLVAERYRDPQVREAVKAAAVLAVHDSARAAAESRSAGRDWKGELLQSRERFTDQVRSWVSQDGRTDGKLATVLDSFVRRADKNVIKDLDKALKHAQVDQRMAEPLWKQFGGIKSLAEKKQFLHNVTTPPKGSGKTPEAHLREVVTSASSRPPKGHTSGSSVAQAAALHRQTGSPGSPAQPGGSGMQNKRGGSVSGHVSRPVPPRPPQNPQQGKGGGPSR
ncbi:ABC transporter permease [Streptomyces sp. NPDC021098]|uniref:ABC transporter permease n=1 Tax=unclassified Streptomyces TaxID=2593676 RepID=UPI0037A79507